MSEQIRQGDPDQSSGAEAQNGDETLRDGYGNGEERGEEQWSRDRYERQAQQVDGKMLDNLPDGERGDVDRMAGGMIPPEVTPGNETNAETGAAQTNPTDAANEEMPGAF
ncbi:MAG: hypothetical protein ACRDHE_01695 [Ktedonobacterales bacterium]